MHGRTLALSLLLACPPLLLSCASSGSLDGWDVPPRPDDGGSDTPGDTPDAETDTCPAGQIRCGTVCVNPMSDAANCGGCTIACGPVEVCSAGVCSSECTGGLERCGTSCADLQTDPQHCGTCDHACPGGLNADPGCTAGACTLVCRDGWTDLDGAPGCEYACRFVSDAESCNGVDDDCDTEVDEGFDCAVGESVGCTTSCGTGGSGACSLSCGLPTGSACTPPAETCNGVDDDCNATCDNGFECCLGATGACTTPGGAPGARTCSAGCTWSPCTATGEACNGRDDDGDTLCDEDFDCCQGASGACTTLCGTTGSRTCSAACTWGPCVPPTEICNGRDDDCDGITDEGFECPAGSSNACIASCGTTGARTCSAACAWGPCLPPAETCNGRDDDCDGACDNGYACCAGAVASCSTWCGSVGTQTCSASCTAGTCVPPAETCNGRDDDCDGACDNGHACCAGTVTACTIGACSGTATCSVSCGIGTCSVGSAPANDTCAGAIAIGAGSRSGSTCGANNDYSSTCGSTGPDVVYRLDIASRSDVVIDATASGSWDPDMHLRSGGCPGTQVVCNDDTSGLNPRITTTLDPGTYYVIVDGHSTSAAGPFTLNVTITPLVVGPPNDLCANATSITLGGSIAGTTLTATNDHTSSSCGCVGAFDVWYRFTVATRRLVWFSAQHASGDLSLHVHQSSCTGAVPTGACSDDACSLQPMFAAILDAGTYYLAVDGCSTADFTLRHGSLLLGNDGLARTVSAGTTSYSGTTSGTGVVDGSCRTGTAPEHLYYWMQCPTAAGGSFSANTCSGTSWDTVLYVRSGVTGADLACNDDACSVQSTITATIPAGAGLYGVYMDGYSSASGAYTLGITRP
jgi:hypothetical protein